MKQDFLNYIQETFAMTPAQMQEFSCALSKPLKKTLRINTNKISIKDFTSHVEKNGWTLTPTSLGENMFYVDRADTTTALGHTLEHIAGYFYVQELAASSSPYYLSGDRRDETAYTILDMSASPGGKTTQLAEYYPNSIIIANEIDKTRMRQLHENTDRLGAKNVFVTNYDGRYFSNYPETFDKVLLDAPCSGEGTAYKTDDALKFWNIKNIKRIAKLQAQLLESAFVALKVGWELVYSTCTLNRLENEEIIEHLVKKYADSIKIDDSFIRAWPHVTGTGWFFVAKLQKTASLQLTEDKNKKLQKHTQGFEKVSPTDEKEILRFLKESFELELTGKFYTYRNEIYYTEKNIDFFWENFFLYKCGVKIGSFESGTFTPNFYLGVHFWKFEKNTFEISDSSLHLLLKGEAVDISLKDGYIQIFRKNILAGIVRVKNRSMESLLETRFLRK